MTGANFLSLAAGSPCYATCDHLASGHIFRRRLSLDREGRFLRFDATGSRRRGLNCVMFLCADASGGGRRAAIAAPTNWNFTNFAHWQNLALATL